MATSYETTVRLIAQLSPVDQARLVMFLAERLQETLRSEPAAADAPAFRHVPSDDDAPTAAEFTSETGHTTTLSTHAATPAIVLHWFGTTLSEEDSLELAMASSIAEWNLDP